MVNLNKYKLDTQVLPLTRQVSTYLAHSEFKNSYIGLCVHCTYLLMYVLIRTLVVRTCFSENSCSWSSIYKQTKVCVLSNGLRFRIKVNSYMLWNARPNHLCFDFPLYWFIWMCSFGSSLFWNRKICRISSRQYKSDNFSSTWWLPKAR